MKYVKLSLFLAGSVFAQEPRLLTVEEAVAIAMKNNVEVIRAQNDYNTVVANTLPKTYGNVLPTVDANMDASKKMYNDVPGAPATPTTSYSASVSANYVIFDGFKNINEYSQARLDQSSSQYDLERTRQDVSLQVYLAYITVLKNRQLLRISEENLKRSEEQLKRLEERNRLGAQILSDVYKQRVQVGTDKLNVSKAKNNLKTSKASLSSLIGTDVNADIELKELSVDAGLDVSKMDFDQAYQAALQGRQDYMAAQKRVESARRTLSISRGGFYPTISASATYAWNNTALKTKDYSNNDNVVVGLSMRIPIFSGFQTNALVVQSHQSLETAKSNLDYSKRKVALDVKIALLNMQTAFDNMKLSEENVKAAKEDLRLATEKYNLGAGTILDQITGATNFASAEANFVQAQYDFIYARQQYALAIGTLQQ